jgi:hypothetical protein
MHGRRGCADDSARTRFLYRTRLIQKQTGVIVASAEQDRQKHTQPQTKQPDRGRRSTDWAYSALFTRGISRIKE